MIFQREKVISGNKNTFNPLRLSHTGSQDRVRPGFPQPRVWLGYHWPPLAILRGTVRLGAV
jgi:hypothetical protein